MVPKLALLQLCKLRNTKTTEVDGRYERHHATKRKDVAEPRHAPARGQSTQKRAWNLHMDLQSPLLGREMIGWMCRQDANPKSDLSVVRVSSSRSTPGQDDENVLEKLCRVVYCARGGAENSGHVK